MLPPLAASIKSGRLGDDTLSALGRQYPGTVKGNKTIKITTKGQNKFATPLNQSQSQMNLTGLYNEFAAASGATSKQSLGHSRKISEQSMSAGQQPENKHDISGVTGFTGYTGMEIMKDALKTVKQPIRINPNDKETDNGSLQKVTHGQLFKMMRDKKNKGGKGGQRVLKIKLSKKDPFASSGSQKGGTESS